MDLIMERREAACSHLTTGHGRRGRVAVAATRRPGQEGPVQPLSPVGTAFFDWDFYYPHWLCGVASYNLVLIRIF